MNLRNIEGEYNIGLDMGTNSVGWAVTDSAGDLLHFKKQPTWGSRLFDEGKTAADARIPRSQRRRIVRRRWRLNLLQKMFEDEVAKVDPEFFIRLRQSRLVEEDRASGWKHPLFNDSDFTEADYYKKFPTIYHLRKWLMETDEKADIRLIYLAVHNIVKHRGNFLREGQKSISAKNANPEKALQDFAKGLKNWCFAREYDLSEVDISKALDVLSDSQMRPSDKKKALSSCIGVGIPDDSSASKKCNEALAAAMVGLVADFKSIFGEMVIDQPKLSLADEEKLEALREACPDDSVELLDCLCDVYSAYLLQGLLSYAAGQTISTNMVKKYEKYGEDLVLLKSLVRKYAPEQYDSFFRGEVYEGTSIYNASKANGYTRYNIGTQKMTYDDFHKAVAKLFDGTAAVDDPAYQRMMDDFILQRFLRRLKTSDNGSIYYQLHLEELHAILENQGRFYPFLIAEREKIESLVTFRIPYYVGPLANKNEAVDENGKKRFSWAVRREGKERETIYPWNWDEIIDRAASAQGFIERMTGVCTYLQGADVLPKCSLLYEEFCVLNELNGAHYSLDGDGEHRFDAAIREGIVDDLFRKKSRVSYKDVQDYLAREWNLVGARVLGGQGETGFESRMNSYRFFSKDVFGADKLAEDDYPMIEKIIHWNTLFEDRKILREKIAEGYGVQNGGALTDEQIKKICKKRFTGWGRLSGEFLTGLKADTELGRKSIMDILREGDPNSSVRQGRTMVLMEIIRDDDLGFKKLIDNRNKAYIEKNAKQMGVNDLPGSPAIRRELNQALRIVDEIAGIAGKPPANIFIEVTREEEMKNKGRTKRRYDNLKEALRQFKDQDPQLWSDINAKTPDDLDERLTLYFMQRGKSLYSGAPIELSQLSNDGVYEVDHIIPRSYVKDDSLENKALVLRSENQRKTDAMLIDPAIRAKMKDEWKVLLDAKLIGEKKYRNLMRDRIDEKAMRGFVNRQIVETSQAIKFIQPMLEVRYPETSVVPVKAGISHDLRERCGFVKCREANDFHHAHDAYLACRVGMFVQDHHPYVFDNPIKTSHVIKKFVRSEAETFNKKHSVPGTSGFLVNSFCVSKRDEETGEVWNAPAEIEGIRKALNYRQCYISRMPYEDTGYFWDQTIYSPRDEKMGKKLSLPLKKALDPQKYGGYSSQQFAYFFVYEAKKPKKDARLFKFAEVPVWLAPQLKGDLSKLEDYARKLAEKEGLEYIRIERAKILKRQLIEIDGDRFVITGKKEMRSAREMAFSLDEAALLESYVAKSKGEKYRCRLPEITVEELIDSFGLRANKMIVSRLANQIKLGNSIHNLKQLPDDDKAMSVLLNILNLANGATNMVDLTAVGGAKKAGCLQPTFSKLLSDPSIDFRVIDQSVTGMFEKRTRIGL